MKKIIYLSLLSLSNTIYAEDIKHYVLDYNSPSLIKYAIASKFDPNTDFVKLSQAIKLYKQIIKKNENKELVRISHYNLSEIYYQIYYSNMYIQKYQKYLKYAENEFKLALYLAPQHIRFNEFTINKETVIRDMPPKFILDQYLYLAPIKLLYYFFYSGIKKNSEFEKDLIKANIYLQEAIKLKYIPAYIYKLKENEALLQNEKFDYNKDNALNNINLYNKSVIFLRNSNYIRKMPYFIELQTAINDINEIYTNNLKKLIKDTDYPLYINKLKNWEEQYDKREKDLYVVDKQTLDKFKKFSHYKSPEVREKIKQKILEKIKKYEEKRKTILENTGRDISQDTPYMKLFNKYKKTGLIFN